MNSFMTCLQSRSLKIHDFFRKRVIIHHHIFHHGRMILYEIDNSLHFFCITFISHKRIPYRLDIYELLNRTSSRIVRVAAACGLGQEFRIVLPPKVNVKNSTSSVYSSLYGNQTRNLSSFSR